MDDYDYFIDRVILLLGDNSGRMEMSSLFYKLGRLPDDLDPGELARRLAITFGYIYKYGFHHELYGVIEKGDWILTENGLSHYCHLKELEDVEIPF